MLVKQSNQINLHYALYTPYNSPLVPIETCGGTSSSRALHMLHAVSGARCSLRATVP